MAAGAAKCRDPGEGSCYEREPVKPAKILRWEAPSYLEASDSQAGSQDSGSTDVPVRTQTRAHCEKCYDDNTETLEFVTKEVVVTAWSFFTGARYKSPVHGGK